MPIPHGKELKTFRDDPEHCSTGKPEKIDGTVVASNDSTSTDALVSRITAVRLSLRPSEQRVASYVLGQPNRVAHMAIAELAEAVGVTDPTIARFCQALGFTGFKAFKVALAKSLATGVPACTPTCRRRIRRRT